MTRPRCRFAAAIVLAAGATWLVIGPLGIVLALLLATVAARDGLERTSKHAALAAAVCLAGSVILTVLEAPLRDEPTLRFAVERPVASGIGTVAGALVVAAVVLGSFADRGADANEP